MIEQLEALEAVRLSGPDVDPERSDLEEALEAVRLSGGGPVVDDVETRL